MYVPLCVCVCVCVCVIFYISCVDIMMISFFPSPPPPPPPPLSLFLMYVGSMSLQVLPRQTCRLFTHTYNYSHFSGGRDEVIAIAHGGEVFMTLLRNPVSHYLTYTMYIAILAYHRRFYFNPLPPVFSVPCNMIVSFSELFVVFFNFYFFILANLCGGVFNNSIQMCLSYIMCT